MIGKAEKILWQNILKVRFRRSQPARRRVFCIQISRTRHSNRDLLPHCASWANSFLQLTRGKWLTKIYRWILLPNPHNSIIVGKVTWETGSFLCVNPAYSPPHTHRIPVCKTSYHIVAGDWYHNVYSLLPLKTLRVWMFDLFFMCERCLSIPVTDKLGPSFPFDLQWIGPVHDLNQKRCGIHQCDCSIVLTNCLVFHL